MDALKVNPLSSAPLTSLRVAYYESSGEMAVGRLKRRCPTTQFLCGGMSGTLRPDGDLLWHPQRSFVSPRLLKKLCRKNVLRDKVSVGGWLTHHEAEDHEGDLQHEKEDLRLRHADLIR